MAIVKANCVKRGTRADRGKGDDPLHSKPSGDRGAARHHVALERQFNRRDDVAGFAIGGSSTGVTNQASARSPVPNAPSVIAATGYAGGFFPAVRPPRPADTQPITR